MAIHTVPPHDVFAETSADGMSRSYTSRIGDFTTRRIMFGSLRREYASEATIVDQRHYNAIVGPAEHALPAFTKLTISGRTITISSDMVLTPQQCLALDRIMEPFYKNELRHRGQFLLVAMPTPPVR